MDFFDNIKINGNCGHDHKNEFWGSPGIKNNAGEQYPMIPELMGQEVIYQQKCG
jgi:hypothetical protein